MKSGEVRGMVLVGIRDSFSMAAMRARWSGAETRVRKAFWRSSEAA